jgi:hypothetical protein
MRIAFARRAAAAGRRVGEHLHGVVKRLEHFQFRLVEILKVHGPQHGQDFLVFQFD